MLFRSTLSILVVVLALSTSALADIIKLKDGGIIKGRVASFKEGRFYVEVGEGSRKRQMTFAASEVESVIFDPPSSGSPQSVSAPVENRDPNSQQKVVITDSTIKTNSVPAQTTERRQQPRTAGGKTRPPIELGTKVLADNTSNGWTNSGWVVKKGQRIRISGDGTISLGNGQTCPPSGIAELEDPQKLLKSVPTGALIAVIGDDNNDFIYIGAEREFTATRDGALFLGVNESTLEDNSGSFDVKIKIDPK